MKNISNERLLLLANAQESMRDLSNRMDIWDESQQNTEKYAFDSINISDHVLNMSREGKRLIAMLQEHYNKNCPDKSEEDSIIMVEIIEEIKNIFIQTTKASFTANDIAHKIEEEIALQKEIGEGIKGNLDTINESLDAAVACAEMMFTEF